MCQIAGRSLIYWSHIDRNIEDFVKWGPSYLKLLPTVPAELLINHNFPQGTGQKISVQIFIKWANKKYLLIIDYFSKYPFPFQMSSTTMTAVITHLTELFAFE